MQNTESEQKKQQQKPLDWLIQKVRQIPAFRQKVLHISPQTSKHYLEAGGSQRSAKAEQIPLEPITEGRARSDGHNLAISYVIPRDRHARYILNLEQIYRQNREFTPLLEDFGFPDVNFLGIVDNNAEGKLSFEPTQEGLELMTEDKNQALERDSSYPLSQIDLSRSRMTLHSKKNNRTISIRLVEKGEQQLTQREQLILKWNPEIRRIHNEAWLNSKHTPSAYVTEVYIPDVDGLPLDFINKNIHTTEGNKWIPFCPDRDKYWGIAARNPEEACNVMDHLDIFTVISDKGRIEHQQLPLNMERTFLEQKKVIYLKTDIDNNGHMIGTEGQTGLVHFGNDPHEGWFYVTQPIPKIRDNEVVGYFALIGRKATLTPEKEDVLFSYYHKT